jgi:hypothetical protein
VPLHITVYSQRRCRFPYRDPHGLTGGHQLADDPVSAAATQRYEVGGRTVLAVSDGFFRLEDSAAGFLGTEADPTAAHRALRRAHGGEARLPVGAFVTPGDTVTLIDAGVGPVDLRDAGVLIGGTLLIRLREQGFAPDDIGTLALSHLHVHHVGWIATADAEPVFTNAQIYVGAADWDFFVAKQEAELPLPPHILECLANLGEAGRVTLLDGDRVADECRDRHRPTHPRRQGTRLH